MNIENIYFQDEYRKYIYFQDEYSKYIYFQDEYREMLKKPINVEFVMSDASLLLPPTGII